MAQLVKCIRNSEYFPCNFNELQKGDVFFCDSRPCIVEEVPWLRPVGDSGYEDWAVVDNIGNTWTQEQADVWCKQELVAILREFTSEGPCYFCARRDCQTRGESPFGCPGFLPTVKLMDILQKATC